MNASSNGCFSLKDDGEWTKLNETIWKRRRFASTVKTRDGDLVVIGGESDSSSSTSTTRHSSVEVLTDKTLSELPDVKLQISRHCAVTLNGIDIVVIGGHLDDAPFSRKTLMLRMRGSSGKLIELAPMKHGRQFHSCAAVEKDTIIVAGGRNYQGFMMSVEVFDVRLSRWTEPTQLQLKFGISQSQLVASYNG